MAAIHSLNAAKSNHGATIRAPRLLGADPAAFSFQGTPFFRGIPLSAPGACHRFRQNRVDNLILSDSAQNMLNDFRDTIQNKSKMISLGLEFRSTLLLYGPPGCGKTSAAKYLAAELKLPLVTARFDTLISSLLGNTAKSFKSPISSISIIPAI